MMLIIASNNRVELLEASEKKPSYMTAGRLYKKM
jgi:hypothetical protein